MILRYLLNFFSTAAKFLRTSSACGEYQVESQARACHSIYIQVVKSHLFNLGLPMYRSFRKPKHFRFVSICANAVYNVFTVTRSDFFDTRNFEIRRRVLRVKKNDEIQKEHTHTSLSLSLSLSLSIGRCTLIFLKGCACTSLSFSLYLHLQKRFGSRSDPMEFRKECFIN